MLFPYAPPNTPLPSSSCGMSMYAKTAIVTFYISSLCLFMSFPCQTLSFIRQRICICVLCPSNNFLPSHFLTPCPLCVLYPLFVFSHAPQLLSLLSYVSKSTCVLSPSIPIYLHTTSPVPLKCLVTSLCVLPYVPRCLSLLPYVSKLMCPVS